MSGISVIERIESQLKVEEEKNTERKKRNEKNRYMIVGIILSVIFVTLISLGFVQYKHKLDFSKAISYVEQGEMKKATILFQKLKGYAHSEYELEKIYIDYPQYKLLNAKEDVDFLFGTYAQDDNIKPIKWYVIEKEDNKVLLLSERILDKQEFSDLETWYDSFKASAFNEKESKSILEITVLDRYKGESLFDDSKDYASATPTTYASGKTETYGYVDKWWTSNTITYNNNVYCLEKDGGYDTVHQDDSAGVRPAIWVSLE